MILLDTHAWVWWVSTPNLLSEKARRAVDSAMANSKFFVSAISAWEVAMLVQKGRLSLTLDVRDWVAQSEKLPFLRFVPITSDIAVDAARLPEFPNGDPADRFVVATDRSLGAEIVTQDFLLHSYRGARCIW